MSEIEKNAQKTAQGQLKLVSESLSILHQKKAETRADLLKFKSALENLIAKRDAKPNETEEYHKNNVKDFLLDAFYRDVGSDLNTHARFDLVIRESHHQSPIKVILELKRPTNLGEMPKPNQLNSKALQELIWYFLQERDSGNSNLTHLVISSVDEWYIFDAKLFDQLFFNNLNLKKKYKDFKNKKMVSTKTELFYEEIAKPAIDEVLADPTNPLVYTYFHIDSYRDALKLESEEQALEQIVPLFKVLSPHSLLKESLSNDGNQLNQEFYQELLYILGLEEVVVDGKRLIHRMKQEKRNQGALIENTIVAILDSERFDEIKDLDQYGKNKDEQLFYLSLELVIQWLNRILFLKLLEALLIGYHQDRKQYAFLNVNTFPSFQKLNVLFFQILSTKVDERRADLAQFKHLPYLNSSLFEMADLEKKLVAISALEEDLTIPLYGKTILKNEIGQKASGEMNTLAYLYAFLDAYDFGSNQDTSLIKDEKKTLINSAVLGLIFEKLNGYRDGSFYTPSFVTSYMCRQDLRKRVLDLFNEKYHLDCPTFDQILDEVDMMRRKEKKDLTVFKQELSDLIDSIKILDPAVGSGHFLVSAMNELLLIKYELNLMQIKDQSRRIEFQFTLDQDEIVIFNDQNEIVTYVRNNQEAQHIQAYLFKQKQRIIENSLYGVDLNPNSVKICRLRLWIELLKNAYYIDGTDTLETLPNLDINIKQGDSLVHRYPIEAQQTDATTKTQGNDPQIDLLKKYQKLVNEYYVVKSKGDKKKLEAEIEAVKKDLTINIKDPLFKKRSLIAQSLDHLNSQMTALMNAKELTQHEKKVKTITDDLAKFDAKIQELESENSEKYQSAFEWRLEFPKLLDEKGNFLGFDLVIGNPPYIQLQSMKEKSKVYATFGYETYQATGDLYCLFYELGMKLLCKGGILSFITSNKWMRAGYGESLRSFFAKFTPIYLIDLGAGVFDSATVDTNILSICKQESGGRFKARALDLTQVKSLTGISMEGGDWVDFEANEKEGDSWVILDPIAKGIKRKIESLGIILKDWQGVEILYGIKTGLNEAFIINSDTRKKILDGCSSDDERKNTDLLIKKVLRGRDIKRYGYVWADFWLIFIPWHFPNHLNPKSLIENEQDFKENYPSLYKHFLEHEKSLRNRNKSETGIRYEWYVLQRWGADYWKSFEKPKIIYQEICQQSSFYYDNQNFYLTNSAYFLTASPNHISYLLVNLNSKLLDFAYRKYYAIGLGLSGVRYIKQYMEILPIKPIDLNDPLIIKINTLVDEIQSLKSQSLPTESQESQIDQIIYRLYDLTPDQIDYIESKSTNLSSLSASDQALSEEEE